MKKNDCVSVVVTGLGWMKNGVRSFGSVLEDTISDASDEIQIAVYMITSGAIDFLMLLKDKIQQGVKITVIVNSFYSQPQDIQKTLFDLTNYSNFILLSFEASENETMHAKIIVVDRKVAVLGSSNLTWGGLTRNHEIGVKIDGPAAKKVSSLIDCLVKDQRTRRVDSKIVL